MWENFVNQSNSFEDVALNVDTNKPQNLELWLDAADFANLFKMEDFRLYKLHKAVEQKKDWIWTSDGEDVISILIQII